MMSTFIEIAHASTEEAPATEEHTAEVSTDSGVLGSLGINGQMFAFQLINFAIVGAIVWFLILKPITKKMAERQKLIDDSIENAKKVDETLRRSERNYQERIDVAKVEANKILENASVEAGKLAVQLKDNAKIEIEGLVEKARTNIRIERDNMSQSLREETAGFIILALEKILNETMDKDKDKKVIEEMIAKLKG